LDCGGVRGGALGAAPSTTCRRTQNAADAHGRTASGMTKPGAVLGAPPPSCPRVAECLRLAAALSRFGTSRGWQRPLVGEVAVDDLRLGLLGLFAIFRGRHLFLAVLEPADHSHQGLFGTLSEDHDRHRLVDRRVGDDQRADRDRSAHHKFC
jgi:hypothetical protein